MSRQSTDEIKNDRVFNGYDYTLQVWVKNGVVQPCVHPGRMGPRCCNQRIYAGKRIADLAERVVDVRSVPNPA